MLVVYTERHPPSPTSSPSLCIPTTKTEARMEAGSAWSLPRCVCQLRAYSSLLTPSPPPPPQEPSCWQQGGQGPSPSSPRGFQLGTSVLPPPSLALSEPLDFWRTVSILL